VQAITILLLKRWVRWAAFVPVVFYRRASCCCSGLLQYLAAKQVDPENRLFVKNVLVKLGKSYLKLKLYDDSRAACEEVRVFLEATARDGSWGGTLVLPLFARFCNGLARLPASTITC
jgi:hypothetical protein